MDLRRDARWEAAMRAERTGDGVAYAAFLGELAAFMRRIVGARLWRLGLNAAGREDVVQEILTAVHLRRQHWDEHRPLLPWLHAIAHYKTIDAIRRLRRDGRISMELSDKTWSELAAPEVPDEGADVDVEHLLKALPAGQRSVVHAVAVEGISHGEAARRLGMSEGSVRVSFHRALKRLRDATRREADG